MNVRRVILAVLSLIIGVVHAQYAESYDFKPVQELERHVGLQDPFIKPDGERIETKEEWEAQRQYIKAMLAHYQYGEMPPTPENVIVSETLSEDIYNGRATRKNYKLSLNRNGNMLDLHFGLVKPSGSGPFPVIIKNDRAIDRAPDELNLEAIRRGYILCHFARTDLGSDINGELEKNRNNGVFLLYPEYSWGTIAAWAWGYMLIIDFFEDLDFIDMEKIVVTGHSRGGKTAFCAGIYEERIALTVPNSSGLGGTASHRYFELGMDDQTIGHASIHNPHWWTPEYFKLAGFETRIPFDAHFGKARYCTTGFHEYACFAGLLGESLWYAHHPRSS